MLGSPIAPEPSPLTMLPVPIEMVLAALASAPLPIAMALSAVAFVSVPIATVSLAFKRPVASALVPLPASLPSAILLCPST